MVMGVVVVLAWGLWGVAHSGIAHPRVKAWFRPRLGRGCRAYRLAYNAVAGGAFLLAAAVAYFGVGDPGLGLFPGVWVGVQGLALAAALYLFAEGARGYDLLDFIGIRAWFGASQPTLGGLAQGGIHRLVRHPWYLGTLLLLWFRTPVAPALWTNGVLTAYLLVGTWLEEAKLEAELGEVWRTYRREVPMLIPRIRWK